jgi:3-hydroxy-D-aspartate aldolase
MNDLEMHAGLIGASDGRIRLNTPALVIEEGALHRNIAAMAAFAKAHGLALRPHAKTHKSADIARLQIAAGAVGVCCAKLGEAEALAEAGGVASILITSPVVTPPTIARWRVLHDRLSDVRVVADHSDGVAATAVAMASAAKPLTMFVDVDPGIHRTGVASVEAAVALARQIAAAPSLRFGGVQFYCGMEQHIEAYADRRAMVEQRMAFLREVVAALKAAGLTPETITGGGTGTHRIDAALGVLTELQAGSYVFIDRQYLDCDLTGAGGAPFETALLIDSRIVSANTEGMATIDAGFKALSTDGGKPTIVSGAPEGAAYFFMGDEHGAIVAANTRFDLGARVVLGAPHCDPTVNLYDSYHVVRGEELVAIWPVTARGRSR